MFRVMFMDVLFYICSKGLPIIRTIPVGCVDAPLPLVNAVAIGDVAVALGDEPPVTDTPGVVSPDGP